ncbi:MAG: cysteine desulfurase family protein [Patescibacteria group bacterium]|nr:cysteine desulfurase family protein [Patescibacteria group bacterium]
MKKKKIYLDYAATTPVDKKVLKAMLPYFKERFGNAMSIHYFGQEAMLAVDKARSQIAKFFNCFSKEIIFTSGATESNNLAIKGVSKFYFLKNKKKPHIITTQFEHNCVLNSCKTLEKQDRANITYLPINKDGIVKLDSLKKAIKKNTILISIMYVNNEIGTVQPIKEIGKIIKQKNSKRKNKILFHTDATQGINFFDMNVKKLNIDLLSFSGHKIYGPKGVGALYVKKSTPIKSIQDGGGHENKMRAGTHNIPGIVGLGKAIEIIASQNKKKENKKMLKLRDYLIKKVLKEISGSYLNGSLVKRSPNNAHFRIDNVEGEAMLLSLDKEGIAVSTASACSVKDLKPSHVLLAIGLKQEQTHGSLRFTLGRHTTKKKIDTTINALKKTVKKLRNISGNLLDEFK